MKALRKAFGYPPVGCAVISLLTLFALLGLRKFGLTQRLEFIVYDDFVRLRANRHAVTDPRIVLCGMSAEDIVKYGYPVDDEKLAELLEKITAAEPCVVGLDLYRDRKEPRSGAFYPRLEETLLRHEQVVAVERIAAALEETNGGARFSRIKPPPALVNQPDRVAPNNLPGDFQLDGVYRRAYLFMEDSNKEPRQSLALELASRYLVAHQVEVKMVDVPGSPDALLQLGKTIFPRLTENAGCYVGLKILDYEILADYRASQSYCTFSFGDVLENRVPPGALKDAIVIAGVLADEVKDNNPTPVSAHLRGPIQHAMVVNQLLRGGFNDAPPTRWWPEPAKIGWIGLCTLLGGALGLGLGSPWKLAPALAVLVGGIVFAGWEALLHGLWIPITTPALGAFAAATFVTSLAVFHESAERRTMRTLFSRHVSKEVLEVLWEAREQFLDGGRLKPHRITATVLFTDLKDYSTISEDMDPAELLDWINEFMSRIAPLVEAHGGIINSYSGDAIMAVFGAPVPRTREPEIDRDAGRAVECALAMRRQLKELNISWAARGLPIVAMRIGIYTGPLVTGSIGSMQRLEYSVLGDTTNTAARLQSLGRDLEHDEATAPCTILIGDPTWQRLHGRFVTRLVGSKGLKGKAKEVIVHSVLSAEPSISPI